MSDTIQPTGAARAVPGVPAPGAARQGRSGAFAAALGAAARGPDGSRPAERPALAEALHDAARSLHQGQRMIDSVIRAARAGRVFSPEELLAVQAGVYRYSQELEIASKLVDKATAAVRQTLQSQQ